MNNWCRNILHIVLTLIFCLQLCACSGDAPWRYDPGPPDRPTGLTATADNGQVALNWSTAHNAAEYAIYFSTTPGVSRTSGTKIATVVGTSYIQAGLANGTTYYFVVTSVNSNSESAESNQVAATPEMLGPYVQADLAGTWNFSILVAGTNAGWMRGSVTVDNAGAVAFNSFLDSTGHTQSPVYLLPALFVASDGRVRDVPAGTPTFQGVMALGRKMIVAHATPDPASPMIAILQKQVPGVMFSDAGDVQGFGNTGGGARRFIYSQIASGFNPEWEFAAGQIGKDQKIKYTSFIAPSNPAQPGDKASMLNISADGMVTESLTGAVPQPAAVIDRGVMSADKSIIVGTATDTSGAAPRYLLRIYQMENIIPNDPTTFSMADLAGAYDLRTLLTGVTPLSAAGSIVINSSGSAAYTAYVDSTGTTSLPPDVNLAMDVSGVLSTAADPTALGKLSYFKDMFVITKTDSRGACSLSIGLRR
ncbi:MAG: fibronectin type III domain-containing protein [Geobacteraceae bacterium]|nr:fibronectin type III domain-containing protein [Geobacteraceae bacterium]